jgi:hypothetical protein
LRIEEILQLPPPDFAISDCRLRFAPDEGLRREIGLHFVMLGGLRYNRSDLPEIV